MPDINQEKIGQEMALRIQRQIGFVTGLFQEDVTVRTLLESLAEGVVVIDSSGAILLVNSRTEQMFGYPKQELIGKPHSVLIPERFRNVHEEHEAQYLEAPRISQMGELLDLSGLRRDGSEFPVEISLGFIKTINGVLILALVSDITLRKQVEDALEQQQHIMGNAERLANVGSWEWDIEENLWTFSDNWYRMHGVGRRTMSMEELMLIAHPDDRAEIQQALDEALRNGEPYSIQHRIIRQDTGEVRYLQVFGELTAAEMGRHRKLIGAVQDITGSKLAEEERDKLEEALRESEKRVRNKLEAILSPEADIGALELSDIIDSEKIQKLMDQFYQLTNIGIGILDLHGRVLVGTGWQDICTKFHRRNPESCQLCIESDLELSRNVPIGTFKLYRCKNNMWDMATPIMLGDKHVGNIFLGQFLIGDETPDYETYRQQARRYGFNEQEYLAALDRVPRWSRETVNAAMSFYSIFAEMIGNLSYGNMKLANVLEQRKQAEEALYRLNRELRAISNCDQTLIRAENEQSLLNDICGIVCDEAGYRMAWVGYAENDDDKTVRPVAWAGVEDGYLAEVRISWGDTEWGGGPTGTAIRSGESACIQDFALDPQAAPWRDSALPRGYRSSIALPLKNNNGNTYGVFHIYSAEPNTFTTDEIRLMEELAGNLAFGIMVLRTRIELKRAGEALRESHMELDDAQEAAKIGFWNLDLTNMKVEWSKGTKSIFELVRDCSILTYDEFFEYIFDDDKGFVEEQIKTQSTQISELSISYSYRIMTKNGNIKYLEHIGRQTVNEEGRITKLYGSVQDITERKRAEDALRESEERFRLLADTAPVMIWEAGPDAGCTFFNKYWLEFTGRSLEQELGDGWLQGVHPDDIERSLDTYQSAVQNRRSFSMEYRLRRGDGEYGWLADSGVPRLAPNGELLGYIGTCFDITERKHVKEELQQANELLVQRVAERTAELSDTIASLKDEIDQRIRIGQALQAETAERLNVQSELREKELLLLHQSRLAAMGEMIGNIAHQWRQPLNMLGLLAQELPMTYKKGGFSTEYLEANVKRMLETINFMSKTIDDFRNFFRPDKEKTDFRILEMIEKTISLLEGSLKAQQIRTAVVAASDPVVNGYPNEFSQVLLNIMINARDAFATQNVVDPTITIEIGGEEGRCVVTITDNAGGIPEEVIDKIFDPYFTTKGPDKGTGVGLYMSKTIVEKNMGGTLSARNVDSGAQFRIEV